MQIRLKIYLSVPWIFLVHINIHNHILIIYLHPHKAQVKRDINSRIQEHDYIGIHWTAATAHNYADYGAQNSGKNIISLAEVIKIQRRL